VIGHKAIGMNNEGTRGRGFAEDFEYAATQIDIFKMAATLVATESDENGDLAGIVFGVEADGFSRGH